MNCPLYTRVYIMESSVSRHSTVHIYKVCSHFLPVLQVDKAVGVDTLLFTGEVPVVSNDCK